MDDNIPIAIDFYSVIARFIYILFVLINQLVIANFYGILFLFYTVFTTDPRTDKFQLNKN